VLLLHLSLQCNSNDLATSTITNRRSGQHRRGTHLLPSLERPHRDLARSRREILEHIRKYSITDLLVLDECLPAHDTTSHRTTLIYGPLRHRMSVTRAIDVETARWWFAMFFTTLFTEAGFFICEILSRGFASMTCRSVSLAI
jgi:hypothetical protein